MGACTSKFDSRVVPSLKEDAADHFKHSPTDFVYSKNKNIVRCSIDLNLMELHENLWKNKLFLPQEISCLGGDATLHDVTNRMTKNKKAYGQLARSHGTFAEYVEGFQIERRKLKNTARDESLIITAWNPESRRIFKHVEDDNDDIYKLIMEGDAEDIGTLTHIFLRPLRDEDFPNSRGMKLIAHHSSTKMESCLHIMEEIADDEDLPADFDYRVTVLTDVKNFLYKDAGEYGDKVAIVVDDKFDLVAMPIIVLYLQWANKGGTKQEFGRLESGWFRNIRKVLGDGFIDASLHQGDDLSFMHHDIARLLNEDLRTNDKERTLDYKTPTPMSELSKYWMYDEVKGYVMPHENRTYQTKSTVSQGWSKKLTSCVDKVVSGEVENLKAVVRVQILGGHQSEYRKKAVVKPTMVQSFDCFYDHGVDKSASKQWEADALMGVEFDLEKKPISQGNIFGEPLEHIVTALRDANKYEMDITCHVGGKTYDLRKIPNSSEKLELDLNTDLTEAELDEKTGLFKFGVSNSPFDLNIKLEGNKLFLPQNLYSNGSPIDNSIVDDFEQIGRSHGCFSDYIEGYNLVLLEDENHDKAISVPVWKPGSKFGVNRNLTKEENDRLFDQVFRGDFKNTGVLTHTYVNPLYDDDFPNSRGMKIIAPYSSTKLQNCLQIMAEMSDNEDFPRDFDYRVTVVTDVKNFFYKKSYHKKYDDDKPLCPENTLDPKPMPIMVSYVQWANVGGKSQTFSKHESGWFRSIRKAMGPDFIDASVRPFSNDFSHMNHDVQRLLNKDLRTNEKPLDFTKPTPMSELSRYWAYDDLREYVMPHENRTYKSKSTNLSTNGWSEWMTNRIDMIISGEVSNLKAVVRVQAFGGEQSLYRRNEKSDKTTIVQSIDCFYNRAEAKRIDIWKSNNEKEAKLYGFIRDKK